MRAMSSVHNRRALSMRGYGAPNGHDLRALLTPEAKLMIACARIERSDEVRHTVRTLLRHTLDWTYIRRHAARHGLEPQLHRHLAEHEALVPSDTQRHFSEKARQAAFRNMRQLHELLRIVGALEERNVPVIPFKGPVLAALAYGDVSVRPFVDLDLLVAREDVLRAKDYLVQEGYEPVQDMTPDEEAAFIAAQHGYEFVHPESGFVVEVHWAFFFEIYAFDLTPDEIWDRHHTTSLSGTPVRTLAPEDLFIYLCMHGTKHRWMRLKWIADVAAFIQSQPDLDWEVVAHRARRTGTARMVRLGCYLAHQLLSAPVPSDVLQAAKSSGVVHAMAARICDEWLFREPDAPRTPDWEVFLFHVKERERWRDRWPYIKHHLKLWLPG